MGKLSRTKGHSFERWVAQQFREIFPDAARHLEYQEGEANGVDISNVGEFLIQCKAKKNYSPLSAIEEVQGEGVPLLVTKGDRKRPIAALYLDDFLNMIRP